MDGRGKDTMEAQFLNYLPEVDRRQQRVTQVSVRSLSDCKLERTTYKIRCANSASISALRTVDGKPKPAKVV